MIVLGACVATSTAAVVASGSASIALGACVATSTAEVVRIVTADAAIDLGALVCSGAAVAWSGFGVDGNAQLRRSPLVATLARVDVGQCRLQATRHIAPLVRVGYAAKLTHRKYIARLSA